ncbi:MAG TPA: FtsH protease activity modulator HflK [Roseiarcus sp.]|nr:FtsH protease activity modulator HflK [Roseiarcus sp.]
MSWNNQGGPWQSRGQGPWGSGPGGSPSPNDIEDAIKRLQKNFSGLPGGWSGKLIVAIVLVLAIVWLGLGTFYTVQPNEIALNLVFGRYTGRTLPGLNTNWPWPIGRVIKVPVQDQQITEIGYRSDGRGDVPSESLMLTGDKNIVQVHFRVNWRIDAAEPENFVFNVYQPRETVKSVAESIMREVVGQKTIDGILTSDRREMEPDARDRMQKVLNSYKIGVHVEQVQLQLVDAPPQVVSAYRDVTAAQQDQQRAINDADTYANRIKPEAQGDAARIVAEGQAYKQQSVLDAKGQTARYDQVYAQYKKAPFVTRERMYLETMEKVFGSMSKTLLDTKAGSGPVPYIAVEPPAAGASK